VQKGHGTDTTAIAGEGKTLGSTDSPGVEDARDLGIGHSLARVRINSKGRLRPAKDVLADLRNRRRR
jgi:hypothetical protein